MYKWDKDTDDLLKLWVFKKWTNKAIANELGVTVAQVTYRKSLLGISIKGIGKTRLYSDEELLNFLKEATTHSAEYFNNTPGLPYASTFSDRFGSWNKALELIGISPNKCSMKKDKVTLLYLVEFNGYYKIGITQQSIMHRLKSHPPYSVVIFREFDNLQEAKNMEAEWLKVVNPYKYIPEDFPKEGRGKTECFILE